MAIQLKAANGEKLELSCHLDEGTLMGLGIDPYTELPQGLVGFDVDSGLAIVMNTPESKGTQIRIGKFLKKLGKPEAEIALIGNNANKLKQLAKMPLQFTSCSDEVMHVYQNGPHSCMKYEDAVKVYATEDVAVAYLELDGKVLARSVVCKNPEIGLQYVRAYGLADILEASLEREGYKSGDLEGCTLLKIQQHIGYVMPYLDGRYTDVDVEAEYIRVVKSGEYQADSTDGFVGRVICGICSEVVSPVDVYYSEHEDLDMCETCHNENHTIVNGTLYHIEDDCIRQLYDESFVLEEEAQYVEERDEYYHIDNCTYNHFTNEYHLSSDLE